MEGKKKGTQGRKSPTINPVKGTPKGGKSTLQTPNPKQANEGSKKEAVSSNSKNATPSPIKLNINPIASFFKKEGDPEKRYIYLFELLQSFIQSHGIAFDPVLLKKIFAGYEELFAIEEDVDDLVYPIFQLIETVHDHYTLAIDYNQLYADESYVDRSTLPAHVQVGIEFTFTNDELKKLSTSIKDEKKKDDPEDVEYERLAKAWLDKMEALKKDRPDLVISHPRIANQQRGTETQHKFTFTLESGATWSYKVTQDPGCVEVITQKTAAADFDKGEIADIIDTYIFGVAKSTEVKLFADPLFGGGHINIDKAAFRSDGALMRFLKAFYADPTIWKKEDTDARNSAFPDELDLTLIEKKILENTLNLEPSNMQNGEINEKGEKLTDETALVILNKILFSKAKVPVKDRQGKEAAHFHAVNLEHYLDADDPEEGPAARVEVRRVPAHATREALVTRLKRIFDLMKVK